MAIDLATGFNIGSKDAIDERQVLTLEQMKNLDETIYPDNYFAMCKDNGKFYIFNSSNAINNTTGKFRLLEGNGGSGSTEGTKPYTSLSELELTPDVTIDDVVSALNDGETALIATSEFTNYLTMFPNQCDNDQYAMLKVEKSNSSSVLLEWLQKEGQAYAIGGLDDSNKFTNWNNLVRFKRDGFGDDNIVSIGNTVSDDGSIQTLENLGLSKDIMTWETGIYKGSDVSGLTNLPSDVSSIAPAHFRLEHHNIQKWTDGRSPSNSIGGQRHSFYYSEGDVYHRYTESGDTAGVFIKDTGWTKICTDDSRITELENKLIKTYNTLGDLGLTAPTTVGEIYNAMADNSITLLDCDDIADHVTDVPTSFGVLTIKKKNSNRFSIDYQNSLGGNVVNVNRWIATLQGLDGRGLTWKLLSTNATYTALSDMGLTADATFQDVVDALPEGNSALLSVKDFTNYQTIFPYEEGSDQYARVHIVKGVASGSSVYARWFRKDGTKEAIAAFNGNDNKFSGWQQTSSTKKTAAFNSKTFKIDITKGNQNWNGNMKFGYCVDNSYGEIIISSIGTTKVTWSCSEGVRYVKSVTYTIDPDNKAHVTIGVELNYISYGIHLLETAGDFARINSITGDAFTGTSVAERQGIRGRNNGVGILCEVADLGLTLPCTTVQIVQAMRNMSVGGGGISANVMIGIFNCGGKTVTITDAPSDYGLLHVETFAHDRTSIRFDGISNSSYVGSWIGRIQGNNGAFSGITWSRIDNDTRVTTLETQVSELCQSVSDGKALVANAITGKGVSTSTTATFATMATNIGKISGGYKEETKVLIVTSNSTGIEPLIFTFSANVIAVKQIVAPSYEGYSDKGACHVVTSTSKNIFIINGKELSLYVKGTGRWEVTALVQA